MTKTVPAAVVPTGWCFCGCGLRTIAGSYFVPAHDRRAEARVVAEQYGSIAAFVRAHDADAGLPPK